MARALITVEYPVTHVELIDALGRGTPDEVIVRWCGENAHVWVTCDADVRSRDMRMRLLPRHGTEVIWFPRQPSGLRQQVEWVVRRLPEWEEKLGVSGPGYSAWSQTPNGRLHKLTR